MIWKVQLGDGSYMEVEADYADVKDGHLLFGTHGYPNCGFAPGMWATFQAEDSVPSKPKH